MHSEEKKADPVWLAFKNGSRDALAQIYRTHVRELLNYGYKVRGDKKLIEDSIQDLFFELWTNRAGLSETTSIRFYLFRALRYKIVRNAKATGVEHMEEIGLLNDPPVEPSHENYLIGVEVQSMQMANLRELISALPKRQQEAINLRYYHNFSNEEVSRIMGVNYQSACKFIYTALKSLKANLQISTT